MKCSYHQSSHPRPRISACTSSKIQCIRLLNKTSWYQKQSKPWLAGAILIRRCALDTSKVKAVSSNTEPVKGAACNTSEILGSNILLGVEVFCVTPETVESTTSRGALQAFSHANFALVEKLLFPLGIPNSGSNG